MFYGLRSAMPHQHHRQHGITLIESLIAIVVASLGILGIIGVQLRTLSDTQNTVRREQAIRLMEDLGERMKINPNALGNMARYVSGWTTTLPTPAASKNCAQATCTSAELAAYDTADWKRLVQRSLPLGDANIFYTDADGGAAAVNGRQLGVMIRWRENEKAPDTGDTAYLASINAATDGGTTTCGTGYTCHLQYIPVSARCAPYKGGGSTRYFCPGK